MRGSKETKLNREEGGAVRRISCIKSQHPVLLVEVRQSWLYYLQSTVQDENVELFTRGKVLRVQGIKLFPFFCVLSSELSCFSI